MYTCSVHCTVVYVDLCRGNLKSWKYHSFGSENETLSKCSSCYLLIYFRKNVAGQCIFPSHGVSCPIGEHLADFRPCNSKVPINSVCFFKKPEVKFAKNFLAKKFFKGPNFVYR
jgi:hypothetical protein